MTVERKRSQASIEHLTLRRHGHSADINLPALRLRTERLLNSIDLQPRGLPPGSLLIVQKVYTSTPISSSTSPQSPWAEHLHSQMETLLRTAARPALGPIPPGATSVLFADTAEMLACLTRDLLKGRAWQEWYWRLVLHHVSRLPHAPGSVIAAIWSEHAAFVPAMLDYLQVEEVHAAIALLAYPEVSRVIAALNAGFALPSPASALMSIGALVGEGATMSIANDSLSEASHPHPDGLPSEVPVPEPTSGISLSVGPPWQRWMASLRFTSLPPQAQYLLGLIITLHHAPSFARSPEFMSRTLFWLQAAQEREPDLEEGIESHSHSFSTCQQCHEHDVQQSESIAANQYSFSLTPAATNRPADGPARDVIFGPAQPFPSEGLLTGLGGILYLVNALKWLDLPASWSAPGTPGMLAEYLGSWAIVELLARGLLDELLEKYAADPIWNVLAMLDNREPGALLGAHLPAQTAFRLPAAWLVRYGMLHNPSLNIHHLYPSALVHPHAHWWLERVIDFIRHLLVRALSEPAIDEHALPEALLCKRGRLIAGRTHVDLYMPMDQVSLPIRRAGLDRDPGWVPDLGRIVLFHFGQEI